MNSTGSRDPIVKNRTLAFKLAFSILTCCSLIAGSILGYNYYVSRRMILKNIEASARDFAGMTAQKIETVLHGIQEVPETLAGALEEIPYDEATLKRLVRSAVEQNIEIYGSTVAFEPNAFNPSLRYFAPYYYRPGSELKFSWLGGENYRYFLLDWYQIPKELGRTAWTEPYYDEGGVNVSMATYSVPFYRRDGKDRRFLGVVTADVSLGWLQTMISRIKIAKTGYAFLISKNGTFVTHPRKDLIMNETLFGLAEADHDEELRKIGRSMIHGQSGFVPFRDFMSGKKCWLVYAPIPSTGWSLAVLFPQDELMADVLHLNKVNVLLATAGFLILLIVIIYIANSITKPLQILAGATKDIAKGRWDFELPDLKSTDEVGGLAASFLSMKDALKKYIRELTETTAIKEHMESELRIAHDIQLSIVPKIFPPFPGRKEFELHAILEPAREVGGDFYDFFFIDDSRLCFVIGDVSGKGVPAALFMAVTKTLIKASATESTGPDEVLSRVNSEISRDNDSCMFVTVFCGILDTRTGEISYANGGHNPPLVLRKDKGAEFLGGEHGPALGAVENGIFIKKSFFLAPGDVLCLYTDGVTEACNEKEELFSEEKLQKFLYQESGASLKALVEDTLGQIRIFAGVQPQSDDITLLMLRYCGKYLGDNKTMKLALENDLSSLPKMVATLAEFGKQHRLTENVLNNLNLVLEELVVNIISYAYAEGGKREILIRLEKLEKELILQLRDDGKAFNPLQVPEPDLDAKIEDRPVGGLGMHMVRDLTSSLEYERKEGWNILTLKMAAFPGGE